LMHCIQMAEDIVKLLSLSVDSSFQFFDPKPGFKVTVYLQVNISKMVRLVDKVTIEH